MPRYTEKEIEAALTDCRGMIYVAARRLKCSPNTIKARIERSPHLQEVQEAERGFLTDTAELKLIQAIQSGEAWGIQFYLKTQGKDRGYVETVRNEHTGADGGPIQIEATDARERLRAQVTALSERRLLTAGQAEEQRA
jgi:hypothetical protein